MKKLETFKTDQEEQLREVHNVMKTELHNTLENKVEAISVKVGNQVASQLLEVFKHYMGPGIIEAGGQQSMGLPCTPMVTQEFYSPTKQTPMKMIEEEQHWHQMEITQKDK